MYITSHPQFLSPFANESKPEAKAMQGDGGLDNALVMILVIFAGALDGGPWEEFMPR